METPEEIQAAAEAKAKADAEAKAKGGEVSTQLTPEQVAKLQEETSNYKKALEEERLKRKAFEETNKTRLEKLEAIEKKEAEQRDNELKKKGEYETLLSQRDSEIDRLIAENKRLAGYESEVKKNFETRRNAALEQINPDKLEIVKIAIEGKDESTQMQLLEKFAVEFKKPGDFGKQPAGSKQNNSGAEATTAVIASSKGFAAAVAAGWQQHIANK